MRRAIRSATRIERAYQDDARALGCVVCRWRRAAGFAHGFCGPTQIHHRNLGDKHGAPQLGQHAVVAMGAWHHQGLHLPGMSVDDMLRRFGPSFHHHARAFRGWTVDVLGERGTEAWQRFQDQELERAGRPVIAWRDAG